MATVANHIDNALQSASSRYEVGSLPPSVSVDWDDLADKYGTQPDANATKGATVGVDLNGAFSAANLQAFFGSNAFSQSNVNALFDLAAINSAYINSLAASKITTGSFTVDGSSFYISLGESTYSGSKVGANFKRTANGKGPALLVSDTSSSPTDYNFAAISDHGGAAKFYVSNQTVGTNIVFIDGSGSSIEDGLKIGGSYQNAGLNIDVTGSGGVSGGGIAAEFKTSVNIEAVLATCTNGLAQSHAVRGQNTSDGSSGLVGTSAGYDFYAEGSTADYGPFTGAHDALIDINDTIEIGDIVVDVKCIHKKGISNTLFKVEKSANPNQKAVVGVLSRIQGLLNDVYPPAAFNDGYDKIRINPAKKAIKSIKDEHFIKYKIKENKKLNELGNKFRLVIMNSLGEGQVNVCGENGDLEAGDLIVTSSIPGKGMKQADEFVRGYTVAKVREAVTFKNKTDVKLAACIYLCG